MIKLQNITPEVYSGQSRDFQFIERLFEIVLNSVKTNSDNLYTLPLSINTDEQLIDLMTLTLGFKSRHRYNVKQLTALSSAFCEVLRNKGTLYAIELAGNALLHSEGITETLSVELDSSIPNLLNIFIPQDLSDTNLLKDLLVYILPAGISCNLIKELRTDLFATTRLGTSDSISVYDSDNVAWVAGTTFKDVKDTTTSVVPNVDQTGLNSSAAKATPGIITNITVIQPIGPAQEPES